MPERIRMWENIRPARSEITKDLKEHEYIAACDYFNRMQPEALERYVHDLEVEPLEQEDDEEDEEEKEYDGRTSVSRARSKSAAALVSGVILDFRVLSS
jgi:hypothetical protein